MKSFRAGLQVFITQGCRGCARALELAEWTKSLKPHLPVEVVDMARHPEVGDGLVFAVPSYVYNHRLVFIGNPSLKELQTWLDSVEGEV